MRASGTVKRRVSIVALLVAALIALLGSTPTRATSGRFPSSDPDPRLGTPDDPEFDCAEPDDEDSAVVDPCANVFDEEQNLFGFAPSSTKDTAKYLAGPNTGEGQVSGVSADKAWKITTGSPNVAVAIVDTGIRWDAEQLRTKIRLNAAELPVPFASSSFDSNNDGAFNVDDYMSDPRVTDTNSNTLLDGEDVLHAFSDGIDDDQNGYIDDIAGWDFFDNDNDPSDTSSYSAAHNHGTGRATDAAEQTDDETGGAGMCPRCSIMPLRLWDSFVVIGDQYGMAAAYAADNGAASLVAALGVLQNSKTAKAATHYAAEKGVALMEVSSDLNTGNHNYPTNYDDAVFINGCVADVHGLASDFDQLSDFMQMFGFGSQVNVSTWFRNSNLTQYGGHAHVCFEAVTGSVATGQAGGAAGLITARGRELAGAIGGPLTSNEIKQLLTMTAEDVLPENTLGVGTPDPAQVGWDQHFGYGRADIGAAVARVAPGQIPPEAWIDGPSWWAMLDPVTQPSVPIHAHVGATRSTGFTWQLQWAPGLEPLDGAFTTFASGSGTSPVEGNLASLPMSAIAAALPGSANGTPPADPNQYTFTVRLVANDADSNRGEDRKVYFASHDPTLHAGWPRFVDSGGEQSPVLYDMNGDGTLEIVEANSSGELTVTRADGTPLPSFNGGEPWILPPTYNAHLGAPAFASGAVPPPTSGFRSPVVHDIDGDLLPDIVVNAVDGRVFALDSTGHVKPGFPVAVDPARSAVAIRSTTNHVKRGFLASPTVADLDGDGTVEIIAAALDGHLYAWEPDGAARAGFPVKLVEPAAETFSGGELISTPAVGDLNGDGTLEIVEESSEVYGSGASVPSGPDDLQKAFERFAEHGITGVLGDATGRIYAVDANGSYMPGWPQPIDALLPNILPFVAPAMTVAIGDLDSDGNDEVVAGIVSGEQRVFDGDGTDLYHFKEQGPVNGGHSGEVQHANLAEYPVLGDLDGDGKLDMAKGGATLNTAVNLLIVGQNLPYDHLIQAWDATTGDFKLGYPRPIDDFTILSTPSIADVGGQPGQEIVAGSGLYLLHAFGALGQEAPGFPKLTGGWINAVPTIGDVDGDGKLELVAETREGWRFMWDLDAPASTAAITQWPTDSHDECHTNRYGTDCRPPTPVRDLTIDGQKATFSPTGDDWMVGSATTYEVRASNAPIDSFAKWQGATPVATLNAPGTVTLPAGMTAIAVVAVDDAGNRSMIATAGGRAPTTPNAPNAPSAPTQPLARTGGGEPLLLLSLVMAVGLIVRRRVR
ncbi:MAG: hypothetical protein QOI95_2053 [Acidimicrobiaceae bacterium]|jgi:hypothetical protein